MRFVIQEYRDLRIIRFMISQTRVDEKRWVSDNEHKNVEMSEIRIIERTDDVNVSTYWTYYSLTMIPKGIPYECKDISEDCKLWFEMTGVIVIERMILISLIGFEYWEIVMWFILEHLNNLNVYLSSLIWIVGIMIADCPNDDCCYVISYWS